MLPTSSPRTLGILTSNTCNARCAHCRPCSGPKERGEVSHDDMLRLIEEAGSIYGPSWCLSLSGGEVFVHYDRLKQYIELAKEQGGYTTVISNGFWALSESRAFELLSPLVSAGLRMLGISHDVYHRDFVGIDRVMNAAKAAIKCRIPVEIRSVASKTSLLAEVIAAFSNEKIWHVNFREYPLTHQGRALDLPPEEFLLSDEFPVGKCPAASLTIDYDGSAMICCNGAGKSSALRVGSIMTSHLNDLEWLFESDPLLRWLIGAGPASLLNFLSDEEAALIKTSRYVNECDLCNRIFQDEDRAQCIRRSVEALVAEQIRLVKRTD